MMTELTTLQDQFQGFLTHSTDEINQSIISTNKVPVAVRLNIYGYAYRARLIDALAANFPIMKTYLGDDEFEKMGSAYVDAYPSTYRSIRWFGDRLATFLNAHSTYSQWPYLAELAQVEWAMTLTFDAEDSAVIDLSVVSTIAPEDWVDMRLNVHPSACLLTLSWNVVQIWQQLSHEQVPSDPCKNEPAISWVFWRKELINHFCSLPEDEAYAIAAVMRGQTFGDVCEGLCQWMDEEQAAMRAASLLKGWISSGLIKNINVSSLEKESSDE